MPDLDPPSAHISVGRQRHDLAPGASLTFGRSRTNDLRLGHDPDDLRVPRWAGRLEGRPDGVLIHNLSDSAPLLVETFPGPGFEIAPLMLVGTMPHDLVTVVVAGTAGRRHTLTVDATDLVCRPAEPVARRDSGVGATVGYRRIDELTARQRTLLCALCLPTTLGWSGGGTVPTYAEMEEILAARGIRMSAKTIRNALDDLRRTLAVDHGIEGVHTGDQPTGSPAGRVSFLPALSRWAVASRTVTDAELEEFDRLGS